MNAPDWEVVMKGRRIPHVLHVGCSATTLGFLLLGPVPARAEDMPRQGDFRITFTSTTPSAPKPVMIGGNRMASATINMMTAVNESGGKLLHNMAGRCTSAPLIDNGATVSYTHLTLPTKA